MLLVDISHLEPGMKLGAPVTHPENWQRTLLKVGFELDENIILTLTRLGVSSVWIHQPGLEFLDKHLGSTIPESRGELFQSVKRGFRDMAEHISTQLPIDEYESNVSDLVLKILANPSNAVYAERLATGSEELLAHSTNVCYLSLLLGLTIRDYVAQERTRLTEDQAKDMTNLGMAGLLHDIGKLGLPDELQTSHHVGGEDSEQYRLHPLVGERLLRGKVPPTVTEVARNHHIQFDGQGFPLDEQDQKKRVASAQRLHIFNRIVAVANSFDACLGQNAPAVEALSQLLSFDYYSRFDPYVLQAFLHVVPPFAVGTEVRLSDGQRAAVVGINQRHPCQPVVRILDTESSMDLDLSKNPDLRIHQHVGRDVKDYYFELPAVSGKPIEYPQTAHISDSD